MAKSRPGVDLGSRSMPALREPRGPSLTRQFVLVVGLCLAMLFAAWGLLGFSAVQAIENRTMQVTREAGVDLSRQELRAELHGGMRPVHARNGIGLGVLSLLTFGAIVWFAHRRVTTPLRQAMADVQGLARGELHRRLDFDRTDELGMLAARVNLLAEELETFRDRVREQARTLERDVEERTEALEQRNLQLNTAYKEVEVAYDELKSTQMQLVQQERMATLGQLLAGIAHEINNPVNYMVNAIRPLQVNVVRIDELLRDHEDALLMALDEEQSQSPRPDLARLMADIQQSVDLINAGASRTAQIVQNLRTFSRTAEGELADMDLEQGLEVTLSLLNHMIRGRIEVVRDIESVGPIECVPGEINQVFMNLLSNAAQAIQGGGTIRIGLEAVDNGVEVTIADSGCGIPEANLARVFEPFFTTKESPMGTGLGLSISHNLVSKHGGEISVSSVEGEGTVFQVWLPWRQERDEDVA